MIKLSSIVCIAGASLFVSSAVSAQTSAPPTPTTRILAIGTGTLGATMDEVRKILPGEVRETTKLYLMGEIDQWYSLQSKPGVVFILNGTNSAKARAMLEALPLGRAHLMTFELIPLGPLNPLRQLLAPQ